MKCEVTAENTIRIIEPILSEIDLRALPEFMEGVAVGLPPHPTQSPTFREFIA